MLLRFGVANHRSIRDYQELLLTASKRIKRRGLGIPVHTLRESAVPVVAVYGPNAAGKSNLVDAMDEFQRAIVRSHVNFGAQDSIPRDRFLLDDDSKDTPTRFDCTFTIANPAAGELSSGEHDSIFEYGFTYTNREFQKEWLYRVVRKERQSTQLLYERTTADGKVNLDFGGRLRGENRTIARLTRPNSLFLSAAAQNNHPQLGDLYRYFFDSWNVILNTEPMDDSQIARDLAEFEHIGAVVQLVRQADLGVTDIQIEDHKPDDRAFEFARDLVDVFSKRMNEEQRDEMQESIIDQVRQSKRLRFHHSGAKGEYSLLGYGRESKGTRTLISLLIPALKALAVGSVLVIDEIDTSLHPDLARAFVSLFKKKETNPNGAQLVFSTHDVTLLRDQFISQDEIWLAEKDDEGVTHFTPLTEFSLRTRDDIERAYRRGRLGGVPPGDDFVYAFGQDQDRDRL